MGALYQVQQQPSEEVQHHEGKSRGIGPAVRQVEASLARHLGCRRRVRGHSAEKEKSPRLPLGTVESTTFGSVKKWKMDVVVRERSATCIRAAVGADSRGPRVERVLS